MIHHPCNIYYMTTAVHSGANKGKIGLNRYRPIKVFCLEFLGSISGYYSNIHIKVCFFDFFSNVFFFKNH